MIVVDTNVIAYLWIPGVLSSLAERLWEKDPDWNAPVLWRSEFRNVVAGYLRDRLMALETAVDILIQAEAQMRGKEFLVSSPEVLRLVARSKCSAYDCEFVVLAEELRVPLITTDKELISSFPSVARPLRRLGL